MATTVSMPQLGETVTEGTILRWAKQVGDTIAEDEVLVEISTDKVDTEIPSPVSGTILEILVDEGETVEVGTELVVIGEEGEQPSAGGTPQPEPVAEESTEGQPEQPAAEQPAQEPPAPEPQATSGAPEVEEPKPAEQPAPAPAATVTDEEVEQFFAEPSKAETEPQLLSPVVRKLIREKDRVAKTAMGRAQTIKNSARSRPADATGTSWEGKTCRPSVRNITICINHARPS